MAELAEFAQTELPQFIVSPPNFEVIQQGLSLINSTDDLMPVISGLGPGEQAELLDQWFALHDPTYVKMDDIDDIFFSTDVNTLKKYAEQGLSDLVSAGSATEVAKEWIIEGGKVTGTGAAVAGERIAYDYATSLAASSSGTTSIMATLSMNLPTAAAAMAPLIGFALGWTLYEAAPEFWEKVSRALLPFCYEDTELMPVMADDKGSTYFPKGAVEAMKKTFDDNSIIVAGAENGLWRYSYPSHPVPGTYPVTKLGLGETITVTVNNPTTGRPYTYFWRLSAGGETGVYASMLNGLTVISSLSNFRLVDADGDSYGSPDTVLDPNIETVYYNYVNLEVSNITAMTGIENITRDNIPPYYTNNARSNAVNNVIGIGPKIDVEGVTQWTGVAYPSDAEVINILGPVSDDKTSYAKIPYVPIATPYGEPGESVQSTVTSLISNSNPDKSIVPWITKKPESSTYPSGIEESKKPAPLPSAIPNSTVSNPENNPSSPQEEKPAPLPNNPAPSDSGTSNQPQNPDSIPFLPGDGIVHVYNPTADELRAFGSWLWKTFSGDIIETVSKLFNNPMDSLIGLHEIYASPNIAGTDNIKCGYLTSNVPSKYVGNRYSSINCGTIVVPEFYNNYLDYSPYTKCFIYLPFIGIVPVHADDIIGNAINITYNIDAYTGSCIAIINVAREGYSSVVYQFQGNCAAELPISSGYHSALMAGLLGVAGTAISGNPHVGLSAANLGRASLGKNEVSHSGSFGATYGAMGAKNPYIIVKRPTQKSVVNYNQDYGFPAHKRVIIGSCTGYLRAREVHVISSTATDEEKTRIEELLKSGVFVQ